MRAPILNNSIGTVWCIAAASVTNDGMVRHLDGNVIDGWIERVAGREPIYARELTSLSDQTWGLGRSSHDGRRQADELCEPGDDRYIRHFGSAMRHANV